MTLMKNMQQKKKKNCYYYNTTSFCVYNLDHYNWTAFK